MTWIYLYIWICLFFLFMRFSSASDELKLALETECKEWMSYFGKYCNEKYSVEMENIFLLVEDMTKKLIRPVQDLDDIRIMMGALKEIREKQIDVDMMIVPIEVSLKIDKVKLVM